MRRGLAEAVRKELDVRKRRLAVMTYDDLLTRLRKILTDPGGDVAVRRLRERFRVVLVDEFQDTDPVQWEIVELAFGEGATLVLIGDPKQAIYAFRGADVYAYLEAARTAGASATLEVNWRSDQGLLEAYDALFGDARLGHEGIAYRSVRAADANREPRLLGAPRPEPLRLRVVHRDDPTIEKTRYGYAGNDSSRRHIAQRPRRRPRRPALLGRADRAPRGGRQRARRTSRCGPATSRCSCARTARRRSCATRSTRSRSPR